MSTPTYDYPFDPTGQAATNKITGEQIIVINSPDKDFNWSMPRYAPFFQEGHSFSLRDLNGNVTPLVLGQHYYLTHKFADASLSTMHPIYGSITWLQPLTGTLIANYQTIGDKWTLDAQSIATALLNTTQNPRITTWEQIFGLPAVFPVIDHPWNLADMVGMSQILAVLQQLYTAYVANMGSSSGSGGISPAQLNAILNGFLPKLSQAVDSALLEGQSLEAILTAVGQMTVAGANAFNGKSYAQMIQDVINTKVNSAGQADGATLAANSTRVFGYDLPELINAIAANGGIQPNNPYAFNQFDIKTEIVQSRATGGTQDNSFVYMLLGEFPIPLTKDATPYFDVAAEMTSSIMDIELFVPSASWKIRAHYNIDSPPGVNSNLAYYSDQNLSAIGAELGVRTVPSTTKSADGTITANTNQLYLKVPVAAKLLSLGIFQHFKNSFVVTDSADFRVTDGTSIELNDVVWSTQSEDPELQAAMDGLADLITELTPTA